MEVIGFGQIENGRLKLTSPDIWKLSLSRMKDGPVVVTVETESKSRSARQLRYYFGVIVYEICRHLARKRGREIPYPKDGTHDLLKRTFLPVEQTDLGPITMSTCELDTKQMFDYCEEIREHFRHDDPPLFIPEPNEIPEDV